MSQPSTSRTWKPLDDKVQRAQGNPISLSTTQVLDQGKDHIVSFEGTSQFTAQGVSACGLAAFNFARVAFRIEQGGQSIPDVLNELSTKEVIEEIVAICAGWSSNMHLEVEDIHNLPIFNRCLHLELIEYGRPRPRHFQKILEKMTQIGNSTVMIITRPPEIIACIKFANRDPSKDADSSSTLDKPVFVIFDSHPRPSHPSGAGLSFSTSVENTARTLSDILPTIDESMFDSDDFQWQVQLLANCSSHVFVAKSLREDHEAAIVQSSMAILELRAHISELQRENQILGSDNRQLESEVGRLRASVRQEQTKMKLEDTFAWAAAAVGNRMPAFKHSFGYISHAVAGPSGSAGGSAGSAQKSGAYYRPADTSSTAFSKRPPAVQPCAFSNASAGSAQKSGAHYRLADTSSTASSKRPPPAQSRAFSNTTGARSIFADNLPPVPSKAPATYDNFDSGSDEDFKDFDDLEDQTEEVAHQLQNEFDSEDRRLRREQQQLAQENNHWNQTANIARRLQNEFDSEDRRLRREHEELTQLVQATFQCNICLDELPEDDVAEVDECSHTTCRSCLRDFVSAKIQEHRYPIFCPMCIANKQARLGVISRLLIEQLGVTEEQSQILTEMELAEFTIQIHCRQCKRPAFVDREDYADVINIVCPQVDCHHVWCKKCEQAIVIDGPKHSCDGSSELDHLMKEKGWKHCPNCRTPIQKETGCNHMSCIATGCNTHFCYICGGMIVRSALNNEINQAVSAHFRKCQLFEVPN